MRIRVTTSSDGELISALLARSYPVLMRPAYSDSMLRHALPVMTRANPKLLSSGTYYVALHDDKQAVGCGGWTFERPGNGEREAGLAHIRHFATDPDRVGQGIGRAVYDRCEDRARRAGVYRFECYSSLNAEGFYAALGFAKVKAFEASLGPDLLLPAILMTKPIGETPTGHRS